MRVPTLPLALAALGLSLTLPACAGDGPIPELTSAAPVMPGEAMVRTGANSWSLIENMPAADYYELMTYAVNPDPSKPLRYRRLSTAPETRRNDGTRYAAHLFLRSDRSYFFVLQPDIQTPRYATASGAWRVNARILMLDGLGRAVGGNQPDGRNGSVPGLTVSVEKALRGNLLHGLQVPMRRTWSELSQDQFVERVRREDPGAAPGWTWDPDLGDDEDELADAPTFL